MNSSYQFLFILFASILYLRSTTAYPMSHTPGQRGFLLCHMSAVACKRSVSNSEEIKHTSMIDIADYLQTCISSHNSLRYCLHQPLYREIQQLN